MESSQEKARFLTPRILLVGLSFVNLVICVLSGTAHYRKAGWGDSWHPNGWLFSIVPLATLPVVGVFVSAGITGEHRMLLAIPFWIILMGFSFAGLLRLRVRPGFKIIILGVAASALATGFVPSVQHIYSKTQSPLSIRSFLQEEVAVSRFLRLAVAGKEHPDPPRLEHDEFNRIPGIPDPPYNTLICSNEPSVINLFLHDYDDAKVLSFCGSIPMFTMTPQNVWNSNKKAIVDYVPKGEDLKLIWQSDPTSARVTEMLRPLRDLATEELHLTFACQRPNAVLRVENRQQKHPPVSGTCPSVAGPCPVGSYEPT